MTRAATANDLSLFGKHEPTGIVARILKATRAASTSWPDKRRAYFLRALAVRVLKGRPLDVEALGAKMRLYADNNICEKRILFTPQYFDARERAFIRGMITEDFVFLDIGANVGGYALFAAALAGPRARILAIEPQPDIFERLVYNIRQNPFGTVKAIDCAVADRDGEITLFIDAGNRTGTSMRTIHSDADGPQLKVPAKTLAAIVREERFAHIDAIKLDVDGAEEFILEPFFDAVPKAVWPRAIVLRRGIGRWTIDLAELLRERGYREALRTRNNVVYARE